MDDYHSWKDILVFIVLVSMNALIFGFGTGMKNIGEVALEKEMEEGDDKAGKILRIINRPTKFVNTVQILAVCSSYIIGDYILSDVKDAYRIFAYLLALLLHVSLGVIVPKYIAGVYPKSWVYFCYPVIKLWIFVLTPLLFLVQAFSRLVLKLLGIDIGKATENVTEEDIMSMVNEGHEQGVLESREAMMISNIFELNDKTAEDVMTKRKNLVCLEACMSLSEAVDFMLNEGINSRYPVYEEDIDNILGVINMKDALIYLRKANNKNKKLKNIKGLIRKVPFVPETKNLDELFKEMQADRLHLVVVIDEYAQTQGIVTLEDILEEIVGNILDEYDLEEEHILQDGEDSYRVSGMCTLDEFSQTLHFAFDEEDSEEFDTLNGFLIHKLGRLPVEGDDFKVYYKGFIFQCLQVENKSIHLVRVSKDTAYQETESEDKDE